MTDLTPEALEARRTLADAIGNGESDAVIVSSEPDGPSLWTRGLKTVVYGAVATSIALGGAVGGKIAGAEISNALFDTRGEISFQLDEPSIEAFADQIGPKIFGRDLFGNGQMVLHVGETGTDDDARFFTSLDPQAVGVNVDQDNECYAMYQPALRDALGSDLRLQNTMESFALGHCLMAGGEPGSVSNIAGEEDLGRMLRNVAAARLIEGHVLGEDGRDPSDPSSVRDAWFASLFSQAPGSEGARSVEGLMSHLVLKRADEAVAAGEVPGTVLELQLQVRGIVSDAYGDLLDLTKGMLEAREGLTTSDLNGGLIAAYNGASPETRLERMDALMADPIDAARHIRAGDLDAYLEGVSSRAALDRVQVSDPFSAPVVTASLGDVQVQSPFELRPEADLSFEDGPSF